MWVLDASVVVKWFFTDEPLREKALEVRNGLLQKPDKYVVPPLFYSEILHVVTRKSDRELQFVQKTLALVLRLGIRTVSLSDIGLARAAQFSCEGFSGYDATYLALADELHARWLTADSKAAKKAGNQYALELGQWV